jgi:glycosyltransferase involved in cell wall biosynthesis
MKSVLMIAYAFAPEGNAGAFRPLRFARHLPSLGWQPTVVTLDTDFFERFDPSLPSLVPTEVKVIRVRNRDFWQAFQASRGRRLKDRISKASPEIASQIELAYHTSVRSMLRKLVRTAEAWSYHPDPAMGWIRPATKATVAAVDGGKVNVIWTTAGPVSSFIAARRASKRTGVPYVLDFRDAWTITFNEFEDRQPHWAKRWAYRSMFRLLNEARAVVFRYMTEAECFWRAYPSALDVNRVHIIPNGFDGDIEAYAATSATDKCRILYTGTLGDYRYDTLLLALRMLKAESPQLAERLELQFVGEDNHNLMEMARSLDLGRMLSRSGAVGFDEANQLAREANALLLLGRYPSMRGYELFAPAKLFGYLKMGRPILGVLPQDEAKNILQQVGVSTLADVESLPDIVRALREIVRAWVDDQLGSLVPDPERCRDFSAVNQTPLLAAALEGKAAVNPFVPGRKKIPPSLREEIQRRALEANRLGYRTMRQDLATQ